MDKDSLDELIVSLYPGRAWEDAVPMPCTSWQDGGPLLEEEDIEQDRCYAPGGWDGAGGVWCARWRGPKGEYAEGVAATMLHAGMLAIARKHRRL